MGSDTGKKGNGAWLLDGVLARTNLKNDAALSRVIGISPPALSKVRHNMLPPGATLYLKMHEETAIPIGDLKAMYFNKTHLAGKE